MKCSNCCYDFDATHDEDHPGLCCDCFDAGWFGDLSNFLETINAERARTGRPPFTQEIVARVAKK